MNLTSIERLILRGILGETAEMTAADPGGNPGGDFQNRIRWAKRKIRHEAAAVDGVVAIDAFRWLGHEPSSAERQAISRGLRRLESLGLVERIGYARARQVRLTDSGRQEAGRE